MFNRLKKLYKPSNKIALKLIHENLGWKWYIYGNVHEVQPKERYEWVVAALAENEMKITKEDNDKFIKKEARYIASATHHLNEKQYKKTEEALKLLDFYNKLRTFYSGLQIVDKIAFNLIVNYTVVECKDFKEDPSQYSTSIIKQKEKFLLDNPEEKKTLLLIAYNLTGDLKNISENNIQEYSKISEEKKAVLTSLIRQAEQSIQK